jgi:VWFA-related protein
MHLLTILCAFSSAIAPQQTAVDISKRQETVAVMVIAETKHPALFDLKALQVEEDGKSAAVIEARRRESAEPLSWFVLLDASSSQKAEFAAKQAAALKIVETVVRPGDVVYAVVFNTEIEISDAGGAKDKAVSTLTGAHAGGGTAVFDAVYRAAEYAGKQRPGAGNKVMLLFTDGDDNQSLKNSREATLMMQHHDITCFPIVIKHYNSSPRGSLFLKDIAEKTGGLVLSVQSDQDAAELLKRWEVVLRERLLIAYETSAPMQPSKKPIKHELKLKTDQKHLKLLYRNTRVE